MRPQPHRRRRFVHGPPQLTAVQAKRIQTAAGAFPLDQQRAFLLRVQSKLRMTWGQRPGPVPDELIDSSLRAAKVELGLWIFAS